jgi:hypothetical protein
MELRSLEMTETIIDNPITGVRESLDQVAFNKYMSQTNGLVIEWIVEVNVEKHYQSQHDQKTHGRWSSGKTYDQFLSEAAEIKDKAYEERKLRFGDNVLYEMYDRAGYNALPTVVTSTEFDALVESGSEELFRGFGGWNPDGKDFDSAAQGYIDEFRYGEYYAGVGVFGNGTYAGIKDSVWNIVSDPDDEPNTIHNVIRLTMKPGSKIISYKEAQILHMADIKKLFESDRMELKKYPEWNEKRLEIQDNQHKRHEVINDLGRWAVMRGYDAIRIPGPSQLMSEVYYNILNRGQVVVQDTNGWE